MSRCARAQMRYNGHSLSAQIAFPPGGRRNTRPLLTKMACPCRFSAHQSPAVIAIADETPGLHHRMWRVRRGRTEVGRFARAYPL